MKNVQLLTVLLLSAMVSQAQFYYTDLVVTRQTNQQYKQLRSAGTKKITATSYDGDEVSKDFVLEQTISDEGRLVTTYSVSINNEGSYFLSYYMANRLVKSVDSGKNAINVTEYTYNGAGNPTLVHTTSKDFDGTYTSTEVHEWTYNDKGLPVQMLKVKNKLDTTVVTFVMDEEGNVAEERWYKKGRKIENYYYYYNPKKQLSDIVRYNARAERLLPDFIFEYDNTGHISSMTQAQTGIANYLVWNYTYNPDGLKIKEVVYGKKRELLGRIEYKYR